MKKTISYMLMTALAVLALSCQKNGKETGKTEPTMKGVFYADIPGEKAVVEIAPGASKSYTLRACAFQDNVTDITMNFSFKSDPEAVAAYNEANGTSYEMAPGSSFELVTNEVMLPRYAKASTSAKLKVSASGLEKDVTYILPITLDKAVQTENWAVADTLAAFVLFTLSDYDPYGPGTETNPYPIASVDDLKGMGAKLVEGSKVYFKLDADIDMAGVTEWTPLNASNKPFVLDGDNHTIKNYASATPLFDTVVGKICNLKVENANITITGSVHAGIIASYGGADGQPLEVKNVHVQGKISNDKSNGTGGLFGIIIEATIDACSANVDLITSKYDVGGIYGYDETGAGKKSVVSNCWTSGEYSGNRMVGGIAGMLCNKDGEVSIINCYSTATVHAKFKYGGIVGDANRGKTGNETSVPSGRIEKCIAWNKSVHTDSPDTDLAVHYSAGAVVGYTALKNYHIDCVRKADLIFKECPGNTTNVLYDQENSSPDSPLVEAAKTPGDTNYNFPYHGKAAAAGETASQVAKRLGWSESVWDLSGALPFFKGGDAPVIIVDDNAGGQLPDFDEHDFYNK